MMRKSRLDRPHIKMKIARQIAIGQTQTGIAREIEISQSSISRFLRREDMRKLVDKEVMRLLESSEDVIGIIKQLIDSYWTITDPIEKELAHKAMSWIMRLSWSLPSEEKQPINTR